MGDWVIGRLGDWGIGELGDWGIGELGNWVIGRLGDWGVRGLGEQIRKLGHSPNARVLLEGIFARGKLAYCCVRAFGECPGYPTGTRSALTGAAEPRLGRASRGMGGLAERRGLGLAGALTPRAPGATRRDAGGN